MLNKHLFSGLAAALFLAPIIASAAPGDHQHGKLSGLFTPEQRVMFVMGARDQIKDMTPEQRHAWRHDQVAKVVAMPAPEQAKLKADLQARWDALLQDRKDRIEQRIAMRQQRHQDGTAPDPVTR